MGYLILLLLSWPLRVLASQGPRQGRALVIQTAKIGDYVNTTVLFDELQELDLVIDRVNLPFAQADSRIRRCYVANAFRGSLLAKLRLGFILLRHRYDVVIIAMPNALNLFWGLFARPRYCATLRTYRMGLSTRALVALYKRVVPHGRDTLTLDTYAQLLPASPPTRPLKKLRPVIRPDTCDFPHPRVGLTLSAGNKSKQIPPDEWRWLFGELAKRNAQVVLFGLDADRPLLETLLEGLETPPALINRLGQTPLAQLPEQLACLDLFIGADTGPAYIADSVGVPVLLYAGPCHLTEQRPTGPHCHYIEPEHPDLQHTSYVFDTLHGADCVDLYRTSHNQRDAIAAYLDQRLAP